ncbi:Basic proline-rich protein precursor [[Actinomadura] parvosata subsp. kistnae]|nr:Basic proline-rich protein precursor [Actinomadura parvosata subsp. kistnae]
MRRPEPGQRGHEHDAAAVGHGAGDGLRLGGRPDDAEPVAQPLHRRPSHEDRSFQRERALARRRLPGHRGQQPRAGAHDPVAEVGQHERARAVGALDVAHVEARLPEQRRLLVAGDAADGHVEPEERRRVGTPDRAVIGHDLRQGRLRHPEQLAQLRLPGAGLQPVQEGARGVGRVGDVPRARRQPGDEVRVHRPDGQISGRDAVPHPGVVLGQPGQLGRGEVGVEAQPGQLRHARLVPGLAQAPAQGGGAAVLPDDRAAGRGERAPVPQDGGLALVGDAHAGRRPGGVAQRRGARREGGLPDVLGVVLDPAGPRKMLREFFVALGDDLPVFCNYQRRYPGCSGVNREHNHEISSAVSSRRRFSFSGWRLV